MFIWLSPSEQFPLIFKDDLHDQFGTWPLAYTPYGGADFGEVSALANRVGDGDDSVFHEAWIGYAGQMSKQAEEALKKGHVQSARDLFLRASAFYAASYHPLYGDPVDPRLLAAFRNQVAVLNRGLALFDTPIEPIRIPFEQSSMPAYLVPAQGLEREVRPLLICPKHLLRFSAAEGAGDHCEMGNRSLLNRSVLDWLDEQFSI